jgi:cytochrome c peroxidase
LPLIRGSSIPTFDNLCVPKEQTPGYAENQVGLGLGGIVTNPDENGRFKVMTLRNNADTGPYAHIFFKSLKMNYTLLQYQGCEKLGVT